MTSQAGIRIRTKRPMNALGYSGGFIRVASGAFDFGGVGWMGIFLDAGMAVVAGEAPMHAGLSLVFIYIDAVTGLILSRLVAMTRCAIGRLLLWQRQSEQQKGEQAECHGVS